MVYWFGGIGYEELVVNCDILSSFKVVYLYG